MRIEVEEVDVLEKHSTLCYVGTETISTLAKVELAIWEAPVGELFVSLMVFWVATPALMMIWVYAPSVQAEMREHDGEGNWVVGIVRTKCVSHYVGVAAWW